MAQRTQQHLSMRVVVSTAAVVAVLVAALAPAGGAGERPDAEPFASTTATAVVGATSESAVTTVPVVRAHQPRIPRIEQWTPTSHSVTQPNGLTATRLYAVPHFRRTSDGWQPMSGELTRSPGAFPVRAGDGVAPTWFGATADKLLQLRLPSGPVTFALPGALVDPPAVEQGDGNHLVSYRDVFPDVDLTYSVHGSQVKELLLLKSKHAAASFTFRLNDPAHRLGTVSRDPDGGYAFGNPVGDGMSLSLSAPSAWGKRPQGAKATPQIVPGTAHQAVRRTSFGYDITLSVDTDWLRDQRFPILLDPTITYSWGDGTLASAYAPVGQSACDGDPCPLSSNGDGSVYIAEDGDLGEVEAYFHMDLSNLSDTTQVTGADFGLGYDYGAFPDADLYAVDTLLQVGDTGADLAAATNPAVLGTYPGGSFASSGHREVVDVKDQVIEWLATQRAADAGFALSVGDTVNGAESGVYSDPVLTVTHSGRPLPPPIPVEQTWGCSCRWTHGYDRSARAADPVNTADGSANEQVNDLTVPAPGVQADFTRVYNGADTTAGPMGAGWTHEFNAGLTESTPGGDIVSRDPTGGRTRYIKQPDGSYLGDPGATATLQTVSGGWTLTSLAGEVLTFDTDGRETSDVDAAGDGVALGYTGSGTSAQLTSLTDSLGHVTTLDYGTTGAATGLLTAVTTADGRGVDYGYDMVAGQPRLTLVTAPDGRTSTLSYDTDTGRLDGVTDAGGHTQAGNTYDTGTGRISSQTDANGETWYFDWADNSDGTVTETSTDPDGNESADVYYGNVLIRHTDGLGNDTSYYYDDDLNLVAVVDALGNTTEMTYDEAGNMLTRTSPAPLSYQEAWTYDGDNNVVSYTSGRGKTSTFTYDSAHRLLTSTDPLGATTTNTYTTEGLLDTQSSPRGNTTQYGYDADGNLTSVTAPAGEQTSFGYDAAGRPVWQRSARGNQVGADPETYTSHYSYDAAGRLLDSTDPNDTVTTNTYDPSGRLGQTVTTNAAANVLDDVSYSYDNVGRTLTETHFDRTIGTFVYDPAGNLVSSTDAVGAVTSYDYDQDKRPVAMTTARGNEPGANPDDYTWVYDYDADGNRIAVTDPAGRVTATGYDTLNRATEHTTPLGLTTSTDYDADGNITAVTDPLGHLTTSSYDDAGRLAARAMPGQDPMTYSYDADGNQTSQASPAGDSVATWTYDTDGRLATQVDPRGNETGANPADYTTSYRYDAEGNQVSVTDQLGHETQYSYDAVGNQTQQTDANDNTTSWVYDGLNRLTTVTGPDGADTSYDYDDYGDLVTRTNPNGHTTSYSYSSRHELTQVLDPLDRKHTYDYDAEGNLTSTVTARGYSTGNLAAWTITQDYNARGLRTAVTTDSAASSATYSYDDDGRLASMVDTTGTTTYSYDGANRLEQVAQPQGDYNYTYNDNNQVLTRAYPDGHTIGYSYDNNGRPASLTAENRTTTFGYDANDDLTSVDVPSNAGATETRTFDRAGRLSSIETVMDGQTTPMNRYDYTRDPVGNPTRIKRTRDTTVYNEAFVYNWLDRLTKYCRNATTCDNATKSITYSYDHSGNRKKQIRVGIEDPHTYTYSYDDADQLTSSTVSGTTTNYSYNADGDLIGGRSWDPFNRLLIHNHDGDHVTFTYDGTGARRTVTSDAGTKTLSWDINNPLPMLGVVTTEDGSTWAQRYTPEGWALSTQHPGQTNSRSYYLHDGQGSIVNEISGAGDQLWANAYEPFGTKYQATKIATNPVDTNIGYTSAYWEDRESTYHLRARDYDPTIGRFNATDPAAPQLTDPYVSSYAYVNSRPTVFVDPSGRCWGPDGVCDAANAIGRTVGGAVSATGGAAVDAVDTTAQVAGDAASFAGHTARDYAGGTVQGTGDFLDFGMNCVRSAGPLDCGDYLRGGGSRPFSSGAKWFNDQIGSDTSSTCFTFGEWIGVPLGVTSLGKIGSKVLERTAVKIAKREAERAAAKGADEAGALVRYDPEFASRNLSGQLGEGYARTPSGYTVSAHAAERIVYGAPGRSPTTLSRVDDILNNPTRSVMRPDGSIRVFQGKDWVAIRGSGPIHIITVMVR